MSTSSFPQNDPSQTMARLDAALAELASLRQAVEHSHRLSTLGTIAASIAHEFNNLLTPVLCYAQMALESPEDRGLSEKALRRAVEGCERASGIASAILEFAKDDFATLEALNVPRGTMSGAAGAMAGAAGGTVGGTAGGAVGGANIQRCVDGALACLAREPARDGIELSLRVAEGLAVPLKVVAVQQVLLNLIINARRAMPRGGRLTIRARAVGDLAAWSTEKGWTWSCSCSTWNNDESGLRLDSRQKESPNMVDGEWVVVEVEDTGVGIPPKAVGRMFGAFVRGGSMAVADGSGEGGGVMAAGGGAGVSGGAGLGLAISRRLVEDVGGALCVKSAVGEGTTMAVVLPRLVVGGAERGGWARGAVA